MTDAEIVQKLTTELYNVAEQLAASTEARMMMADTIAVLRNRVADLERENAALQGARRVLLTLTDRGDEADGYCAYDEGMVWVRKLEAAG